MDRKIIIGVAGRARSGKNTLAKYLEKYHAFHEDSFAAPIRAACIAILGITLEELDEIKHLPHPLLGGKTPREFMQKMGTEFGRMMIWSPIWVESLFGRNETQERLVISDTRFINEAEAIKERGGFIIRVERPGVMIELSKHPSEKQLPDEFIDYTIINDSSVVNLYTLLEDPIRKIFNIKDNA